MTEPNEKDLDEVNKRSIDRKAAEQLRNELAATINALPLAQFLSELRAEKETAVQKERDKV